jgi:uncharacterized membrane protein YgdD (TMEM256/DUF423 family)
MAYASKSAYFYLMNRIFIKIAALLGALTVGLGAFGAHALKKSLTAEELAVFETGVRYQAYHTLALLVTAMLQQQFPSKYIKWSGRLFIIGIIIFCGSLYLLSVLSAQYHWLGMITPLGGVCFISAWLCMFMAAVKIKP